MNILHIVPSAFEYFNDIRSFVFSIVEELDQFQNINQEVFTLQYGSLSKAVKVELETTSPSRSFQALRSLDSLLAVLEMADVVHLHAPFLGGAKKIYNALNDKPLIVSYYRRVFLKDAFSFIIYWYNEFYLSRFIKRAGFITFGEFLIRRSFKNIIFQNNIPYINIAEKQKKEPLTSSLTPVQLQVEVRRYAEIFLQVYQSI